MKKAIDKLCLTLYTGITTDRENSRFVSMDDGSVFSLLFLGNFLGGELILLWMFRIIGV